MNAALISASKLSLEMLYLALQVKRCLIVGVFDVLISADMAKASQEKRVKIVLGKFDNMSEPNLF